MSQKQRKFKRQEPHALHLARQEALLWGHPSFQFEQYLSENDLCSSLRLSIRFTRIAPKLAKKGEDDL